MNSPLPIVALLLSLAPGLAHAEAAKRPLSLSINGSASTAADSQTTASGQVSLQYDTGSFVLGAGFGTTRSDTRVPSIVEVVDSSSIDGVAFVGTQLGGFDLDASFGYSRQTMRGTATAGANAPALLVGRSVGLDGVVTSTNVAASISRGFGTKLVITPSATIAYGKTTTRVATRLANGTGSAVTLSSAEDGWTLGAAIGSNYQASSTLAFGLDGSFNAATSGAALRSASTRSGVRFQQRPQQPAGAQQWGEVGAHLVLGISKAVALSAAAGTTVGLDADQTYGSTGVTVSF